jgi:mannose-6-phosphate isomerase-like protein (cupin superfamily)
VQPAAANPILTTPHGTVFSEGDELYDQRFRERYVVLETARASGGGLVRVEDTAAPGPSRRPTSAHPSQRERFEVLAGTLELTVDGEQHLLGPGDSFTVAPGARHLPRNAGDGELRFVAEMRPAGRFEEFLAQITAVNNSGREGLRYVLTAARVLNRFPDVEHPTPLPRWLERALFAILDRRRQATGPGNPAEYAPLSLKSKRRATRPLSGRRAACLSLRSRAAPLGPAPRRHRRRAIARLPTRRGRLR